ncbi:COQ4 (predicted) [Pycnogonum litorale]
MFSVCSAPNRDNESKTHFTDKHDESTKQYSTHIPITRFQRLLLTVGSAAKALTDPSRDDMVAVLGETCGADALQKIRSKMLNDPEGHEILRNRPRINSATVDFKRLEILPAGTLGHEYVKFLNTNNVTPDSRLDVQFVDDPDLAYVMQRYREVHDLYHTVLGMPTNMLGEVAVKWVEALQTGLPMCIGAALFGPIRFRPKQRQQYLRYYLPWAVNCGIQCKLLMNVYFEKRWEDNIDELRKSLNIKIMRAISMP